MKSVSVWFVLLCAVKIVSAFSITNQLSIENLTATPELIMNISDSQIDITIDEFNISDGNESVNFDTRNDDFVIQSDHNYSISQTEFYTDLITPTEHWRNSILKHQSRTSRSFFGLFIIPC